MTKKQKENPEIEVLKGQLARALADYDNLSKRTSEERINFIKYASQGLVQNLLPVLDTLENAQIHLKDQGLAIAITQFREILKQEGLEEIIPKEGEEFDENLMEAVEVISPSTPESRSGQIASVLAPGWKFVDGQVVRHARVKVFKAEKAS